MFIFLLRTYYPGDEIPDLLKFQYVYISTTGSEMPMDPRDLKIPICLYFYVVFDRDWLMLIPLKFQYVYISTVFAINFLFYHQVLKFQYVYISTRREKQNESENELKIPICLYFY